MPPGALIQFVPGVGCLNVGVSWKLNDDPDRPNKMSKTIAIAVSHEAAQDFASASAANQVQAFERVATFLKHKLAQFDPSHNSPKYDSPPVEHWVINTAIVNG
jgi:hypothetical protein